MLSKLITATPAGFVAGVYHHEGRYGVMVAVLVVLAAIHMWVLE